jgi:hypothetical protein
MVVVEVSKVGLGVCVCFCEEMSALWQVMGVGGGGCWLLLVGLGCNGGREQKVMFFKIPLSCERESEIVMFFPFSQFFDARDFVSV